jgi:NAD(P)-dependent dehydrogenase (short-subunit alcohol dehydrogenase family)
MASNEDSHGRRNAFTGKLAVVTGGASGMGQELVVQLAEAGCSVATCDLSRQGLAETERRAAARATKGALVTTHACDVSDQEAVNSFCQEVRSRHRTDHINYLFNNAGIAGGDSFITGSRADWERVFNVCWGGVYNCTRAFMPLLVASDGAYLINTSSVAGFWAAGDTAYSAAKFAVRGFSEGLISDLQHNAPHVRVAVVMPGATGTEIFSKMLRDIQNAADLRKAQTALTDMGIPLEDASESEVRRLAGVVSDVWREFAPTTASDAASVILDGIRCGRWRILVGGEAERLDQAVRASPESAYEPDSPIRALMWPWFVPLVLLFGFFDPEIAGSLTGTYELRHRGDRAVVQVMRGQLKAAQLEATAPDAVLEADSGTVRGLMLGAESVSDAIDRGRLSLVGDRRLVEQLISAVKIRHHRSGVT